MTDIKVRCKISDQKTCVLSKIRKGAVEMERAGSTTPFIDIKTAMQIMEHFYEYTLMAQDRLRDYGNGDQISYTQVHVLAMIRANPGINATELAIKKGRKKSTISQILALLEKKGYLYRVSSEQDLKCKELYLTQRGQELCSLHDAYDEASILRSYQHLLKHCSEQDVQTALRVLSHYTAYLETRSS